MGCEAGRCNKTSIPQGIFIVTPSLEGWPTKAKEAPSPHEVRLNLLYIKLVFQCLWELTFRNFALVLDHVWKILHLWYKSASWTLITSCNKKVIDSCVDLLFHNLQTLYNFQKALQITKK